MKKALITAAAVASLATVPAQAWAGTMASNSMLNLTINVIGGQNNFFIGDFSKSMINAGGNAWGWTNGKGNAWGWGHGKGHGWGHYKSRGC